MDDQARSRSERRLEQRSQRRRRTLLLAGGGGAAVVLAAVVAVLVLSGGDDSEKKATAQSEAVTTTSAATTSAPATAVSSAPPDTSIVPKSTNPIVALAQQYDGRYIGTFTNTTFGTGGPATLQLRVDPATGEMVVNASFDGDLFGGGTAEPRDIETNVKLGGDPNAAVKTETTAFGPVTGTIDASLSVVLKAPDVPAPKVKSFELTGRIKADYSGFDATYTVAFDDGSTAKGVVSITCATDGQRSVDGTPTLCSPG